MHPRPNGTWDSVSRGLGLFAEATATLLLRGSALIPATTTAAGRQLRADLSRLFAVALAISALMYFLLVVPIRAMASLVSMLGGGNESLEGVHGAVVDATRSFPLLLLLAFQRAHPPAADHILMHGCSLLFKSPGRLDQIRRLVPVVHWKAEVIDFSRQLLRRIGMSLVYLFLRSIPLLGRLAVPILTLYLTWRSLGRNLAITLAILSILPGLSFLGPTFLDILQDTRTVSRELMQAYFTRCAYKPKDRRSWFRRWGWTVTGFAVGVVVLEKAVDAIGVWGAGAVVYVFGQVAVARLVECILEWEEMDVTKTR